MSGRLLRSATWPLLLTGLTGLALRITYATRPDVPGGDERAALILAILPAAVLSAAWAAAGLRAWRKARSQRRDVRRAVLLRHADPLAETVAEHGRQIAFLTSVLTGAAEGYEIPGDAVAKTQPILKIIGGRRDSA